MDPVSVIYGRYRFSLDGVSSNNAAVLRAAKDPNRLNQHSILHCSELNINVSTETEIQNEHYDIFTSMNPNARRTGYIQTGNKEIAILEPLLITAEPYCNTTERISEMKESTVKNHRKKLLEAESIKQEIIALYDTRKAVTFDKEIFQGFAAVSPTEKAVFQLDRLKAHLVDIVRSYVAEEEAITIWLESIPDPVIRSIIRSRFLAGKTWAETAKAIYHRNDPDTVRVQYNRYKKKHHIYEEQSKEDK